MGVMIINGTIINDDGCLDADVYVEGGVIKEIGSSIVVPEMTKIIDARGKLLIPGGIDVGTYLNFVGTADDYYSGTKAALAGGTTTIFNYVDTKDDNKLVDSFRRTQDTASAEVCCNFGLIPIIKSFSSNTEEEMRNLITEGINTLKISMTRKEWTDEVLLKFFKTCIQLGVLPLIHAENGEIIAFVEEEATNRAIVLASTCNAASCIVNVTGIGAAKIIAQKREQGCQVFGQPSTASLALTGNHYLDSNWHHAAQHVMSPPLRLDPSTPTGLLQMLSSGSLEFTGSAHKAYTLSAKEIGLTEYTKIPSGSNGIQSRMAIIWQKAVKTGILDRNRFVAITSTNAAKILNIYPRKGKIAVGSDADVVIFHPDAKQIISSKTHLSSCDFDIFQDIEVGLIPEYVMINGKVVVEERKLVVDRGDGQYISTKPFSPHVFSRLIFKQNIPMPVARPLKSDSSPKESAGVIKTMDSLIEFHKRPLTRAGGRNLQDSTFALSGRQIDEKKGRTTGVRVMKPPGGDSTSLW